MDNLIKIPRWIDVLVVSKFSTYSYIFVFGVFGFLKYKFRKKINISSKFKKIRLFGNNPSLYFTYVQLLNSLFYSILNGHSMYLELRGVGFKYKIKANTLFLILGFSHIINYCIPTNVIMRVFNTKLLKIFSNNLLILNQVIYNLKKKKKFNVYKGKGIVLKDEILITKEGKKASSF
jgi:ribosomal protein L6P/L9E